MSYWFFPDLRESISQTEMQAFPFDVTCEHERYVKRIFHCLGQRAFV